MYRLWHEICLLLSALGVHIELLCFALLSRALVCLWCLLRWMVRHYTAVRLFRAEINNLNGSRSLSLSLSSVPQLSASYLEYTHVVVKWANIHILHIQQHTRLQLIRPSLCATFASAVQTNHTSLIRLLCLSSTDVYIHLAYFYLFPTLLRSAIRFIVQVI